MYNGNLAFWQLHYFDENYLRVDFLYYHDTFRSPTNFFAYIEEGVGRLKLLYLHQIIVIYYSSNNRFSM